MEKLSLFFYFILAFTVAKNVLSQDEGHSSGQLNIKGEATNIKKRGISKKKNAETELKQKRKREDSNLDKTQDDVDITTISEQDKVGDLSIFIDKFSLLFTEEYFNSVYEVGDIMKLISNELQKLNNENVSSLIRVLNLLQSHLEKALSGIKLAVIIEMHKFYNSFHENLPKNRETIIKKLLSHKLNFDFTDVELSHNTSIILNIFKKGLKNSYMTTFNIFESIIKYKNSIEELPITKLGSIFGNSNYSSKKRYTKHILSKVENIIKNVENSVNSGEIADYSEDLEDVNIYIEKLLSLLGEEIATRKEKCINELLKEETNEDIRNLFVKVFLYIQKKKIHNAKAYHDVKERYGLTRLSMSTLGPILNGYTFINVLKGKYISSVSQNLGREGFALFQNEPTEEEKKSYNLVRAYKSFASMLNAILLKNKLESIKKVLSSIENFNSKIIKFSNLNDDDQNKGSNISPALAQIYLKNLKSEFMEVQGLFSRDFTFLNLKVEIQKKVDLISNLRRSYEEIEMVLDSALEVSNLHLYNSDDLEEQGNLFKKENVILSLFTLSQKIVDALK
ncbi:Plasmodium exported protein, unknown function [Plasmodium relictum]|uniref:Reticulocyte binding protein n=1 Tax=Plasmodium relictum TaxID=85471 RepID=A0A1J1H6I6_PLARL|nr:Plasmodium exported protein, unknown function [Plasmodium relictum]CRH00521.1 Plasmodium exported protein, unknown function [Plasmodium relictum]